MRALLGFIFLLLFIVAVLGLLDVLSNYLTDVNYTVEQKLFIITLFAIVISILEFVVTIILVFLYEIKKGILLTGKT
jgi:hypothetical protein